MLEPSIWVGESYGRIFSPIQQSGCEALAEIITRVGLFIILPFAAVLAAFFIPFGLAAKGLSLFCCEPLPPSIPLFPPQPNNTPVNVGHGTLPRRPPSPGSEWERPHFGAGGTHPKIPEEIRGARVILKQVRLALGTIDRRNIDPRFLEEQKKRLESASEIKALLGNPPEKDTSTPLGTTLDEYQNLLLWIESLQFQYDFFGKAVRESDRDWLAEGEESVSDNGDCLFEASQFLSDLSGSLLIDVGEERQSTVSWMQDRFNEDEELQRHLINSMAEHFLSKIEHLQADLTGILRIEESLETKMRAQEISEKIELIETAYIPAVTAAMGGAHSEEIDFDPVRRFLDEYFYDISQKGAHAGRAELYALSHRHKVCFKIHAKRPEEHEVDAEPYIVINPEYESIDRPARHFTHTHNHYNPYTPPSSI